MEAKILELAFTQGIWAVLFVGLLFYVLKQNEKRETKLLNALSKLECVASDVKCIKEKVDKIQGGE